MAVLLLFNENEKMSFADISAQCQLDDKELRRTLQSVVDVKILVKEDQETEELSSSSFVLNKDFSNKRTKLKITAAVQKETPQVCRQVISC